MAPTVVAAPAVVADAHTILAPGALAYEGETLTWVGDAGRLPNELAGAARLDLSDLVVIPAFVNAHTHLWLSELRGAIPPSDFCTWIMRLVKRLWRDRKCDRSAATEAGIRECLATGTAAVGDVVSVRVIGRDASTWEQASALDRSIIGGVAFVEVLGIGRKALRGARRCLYDELPELSNPRLRLGVSPHSPYGAGEGVYRLCGRVASENGWRLMTHLAETREEGQFLRHGTGPLRAIATLGQLPGTKLVPPGCSPAQYMDRLGLLSPSTILAHFNYPSDDDIRLVADAGAHVVFCPGSHRFFGHDPHPVERLLAAGINVALGTDSLASNESLSMLREVHLLRRAHPGISAAQALNMATRNGASALGIEDTYGVLKPGMSASFLAVRPGGSAATSDPLGAALSEDGSVELVVVAGRRIK